MKKIILILLLFILIPKESYSQNTDNNIFMGMKRADILNSEINKYERKYTGNYNELVYLIDDDTAYSFDFDENDKCIAFIIHKNKEYFERALLLLSSDFPNKKVGGDIHFFWNSKMMAAVLTAEDHIEIVYQKVLPQLLKQ